MKAYSEMSPKEYAESLLNLYKDKTKAINYIEERINEKHKFLEYNDDYTFAIIYQLRDVIEEIKKM